MVTRQDLETALSLAREAYRQKDPQEQAARAGAVWQPAIRATPAASCPGDFPAGSAVLRFLGADYEILSPYGEVRSHHTGVEPALWEMVHILHYYNMASGEPLAHELIAFEQVPEGRVYRSNFEKRAAVPLLKRFGRDPEEVRAAAELLGGRIVEHGDFAVSVPLFPRVPVILVFWRADEEFPPRLSILFDRTVAGYLPTEDVILGAQQLSYRLIKLAGG